MSGNQQYAKAKIHLWAQGYKAGMGGLPCAQPGLRQPDEQWLAGWRAGQEALKAIPADDVEAVKSAARRGL